MKNNILNLLDLKGISIRQMSKDMKLDYSTAHRIATKGNLNTISLGRIIDIADYLSVEIQELYL